MTQRFYHRPLLRATPPWPEPLPSSIGDGAGPDASALQALADLLTGELTLEAVFGHLIAAGWEVEQILAALEWLDQGNWLQEAPTSELAMLTPEEVERYGPQLRGLAALYGSERTGASTPLPVHGLAAQGKLKQSLVVVLGGGMHAVALAQALLLAGLGRLILLPLGDATPTIGPLRLEDLPAVNPFSQVAVLSQAENLPAALGEAPADLLVYCPDRFDEDVAKWLNEVSLTTNVPLLFFRLDGVFVELGPLVTPHETACYRCYRLRRQGTAALAGQTETQRADEPRSLAFPIGVDWLALEAIKHLTRVGEPVTYARLWRFSLTRGEASVHPVLKLPRCPACGVHRRRPALRLWEE